MDKYNAFKRAVLDSSESSFIKMCEKALSSSDPEKLLNTMKSIIVDYIDNSGDIFYEYEYEEIEDYQDVVDELRDKLFYVDDFINQLENQLDNKTASQKLDQILRENFIIDDKQEFALDTLQKVNGFERGTLDYIGCFISGNYKHSVSEAIEFLNDELGQENKEMEELLYEQ